MSNQGPPPNYMDGQFEFQGNEPEEGLLPATYEFKIVVSSQFLRHMEKIAHVFGLSKHQFDQAVFMRGVDAIVTDYNQRNDKAIREALKNIAPLGTLVRRSKPEW